MNHYLAYEPLQQHMLSSLKLQKKVGLFVQLKQLYWREIVFEIAFEIDFMDLCVMHNITFAAKYFLFILNDAALICSSVQFGGKH